MPGLMEESEARNADSGKCSMSLPISSRRPARACSISAIGSSTIRIDNDTIDTTNLNRVHGSHAADVVHVL